MIHDKNRIFDGFVTLESGVDSGRAPNLIDTNQVASAENMVFRRFAVVGLWPDKESVGEMSD